MTDDARVDALRGAASATVRAALDDADPLPGTSGFAGALDTDSDDVVTDAAGRVLAGRGGRLVRDVLGRQPLFVDDDGERWSVDPTRLHDPCALPAGATLTTGVADVDVDFDADAAVDTVWTIPDPPAATDRSAALRAVETAIASSVADAGRRLDSAAAGERTAGTDDGDRSRLAVAFSGGVDSALVAAGLAEAVDGDVPLYVVGFPDSHDVAAARAAADAMGCGDALRVVELTHDALRQAVPAVARATRRTNPMDVQIALPLYLAARAAAADGATHLAVGQGADELFGGYAKVVDPADDGRVDAGTVRGARRETVETLPRQLERDVLALRSAGVEPVAPFLDDRVVEAALPLPDELLATPSTRKVALRRAARGRLPDTVVDADKKAVQYGSLVSRELDRLARQAGFKRRMDDHVGRYVRSLLDEA